MGLQGLATGEGQILAERARRQLCATGEASIPLVSQSIVCNKKMFIWQIMAVALRINRNRAETPPVDGVT